VHSEQQCEEQRAVVQAVEAVDDDAPPRFDELREVHPQGVEPLCPSRLVLAEHDAHGLAPRRIKDYRLSTID